MLAAQTAFSFDRPLFGLQAFLFWPLAKREKKEKKAKREMGKNEKKQSQKMQYTIEESKTFNNIFTIYDECYYCEKKGYLAIFIDRDDEGLELCEKCTEFLDMTDYIFINELYSQADEDNM